MNSELKVTLQTLHELLNETDKLDQEDIKELRTSIQEIEDSLEKQEISSASLAERLEDTTKAFAKEHPDLTRMVGQIAQTLSQMGI